MPADAVVPDGTAVTPVWDWPVRIVHWAMAQVDTGIYFLPPLTQDAATRFRAAPRQRVRAPRAAASQVPQPEGGKTAG
jgi:hypothetical protein